MRILIAGSTGECMPPPYGGTSKVSLLYARAFKKLGHDVGIAWVYRPTNADDENTNADYFFEYSSKPSKLSKIFFLATYFFKNPSLYIYLFQSYQKIFPKFSRETFLYSGYGVWFDEVVSDWKPNIIACQAALIKTFMNAEIAKRHNVPIVFEPYAEIHDQHMGVNKLLSTEQQKTYWTYFLGLADLIIGMDNCTVGPRMYASDEKVKEFYDTIDCGFFGQELSENNLQLRDYFKLPHDLFLVGMVGAFHYRKGHDHLIKTVGKLKRQGAHIGAVIVGGNVGLEKWIDLAKEQDVSDRVYFLHNLTEFELVKLHNALDLYANFSNSTRSCGLDLALLGAMAAGLPIIVYDNGALPTAVPASSNGLVVPTGDIDAIAQGILHIAQLSQQDRDKMGEASQVVASKCDINKTSKQKITWFEEIIAQRISK